MTVKNVNFDMVHALTKKAEALTVYDQYMKDSGGCERCQEMWRQIKQDDSRHHDSLLQEITRHAREGRLD